MKKTAIILCTLLMMATRAGCGETDYSNTTVTGQVTEIDGTKVTLQLGEMEEMELPEDMADMFDGEMPSMPEGMTGEVPSMPEGGMGEMPGMPEGQQGGDSGWSVQDGSEVPTMPEGELGEMPELPEGATGETPSMPEGGMGEIPDMSGQGGGMMQGGMSNFTAGDETLTIDLADATISFGFGQMTMEGDISMISEDSILVVEFGDNNTVISVTVQGGFGNRGQMGKPAENTN